MNQYEVEVDTPQLYNYVTYNNPPPGQPFNFTLGQLFGNNLPSAGPTASFINLNNKTPYTYQWNLSIGHTVKNWLLETDYMGSETHHFEERTNYDPLSTAGTFPYTGWTALQDNVNAGSAKYNGLTARVEHRYSSGFSVLGSYTFSKALSDPYQDQGESHPFQMSLDRGHSLFDLNHSLTASAIYDLPFGRGKVLLNRSGFVNAVAGGWQVSTIIAIHSGAWQTLASIQNLGFFVIPLPNVIGPINNSSLHSGLGKNGKVGPYFNVNNVQLISADGVQGDSGWSNVISPGAGTVDLAVSKEWTYGDRYHLTFRAEGFNAFNRVNFTGLDVGAADPTFGDVTSAAPAREIQLSLRLAF
jgi:hypothetical protein